jgi:hypothetical protein
MSVTRALIATYNRRAVVVAAASQDAGVVCAQSPPVCHKSVADDVAADSSDQLNEMKEVIRTAYEYV